ncbi:TetR/AcrR family transcriptional regulator [Niallia sp. Sow4_A1]|jgi:AcrR family transcriptional regulator|uniref:Helix-turn-helix domain-containing protein n=1 Tax=Niallia hominis TaxID=3133173 RepID=A0ABV1F860_9BACI|nr:MULTISPECIES: TetR/AcrR family transcriptional regulator [Bacillaceae]MCF2650339.1 TetR/AcrR family transcriptional regulator [Niallia circulans]MCM3364692.1 TetR/AcrR family transcriptional regulator [Niallia sp. MER TA 168]
MNNSENILEIILKEEQSITDKQKKILIAAIDAFSEKGYAATSTSEIAKMAGVAEGTIFRHYKTKKDLLLTLLSPLLSTLIAPRVIKDFDKVLNVSHHNFEDFLRAIVKNRMEFLQKNNTLFKILIQEIPFHDDLRETFKNQIAVKIFGRFQEIMESYKEKGEIISIPSFSSVRLTVTSIIGYFIARHILLPDIQWDDEEEIERTIQFILFGLKPRE